MTITVITPTCDRPVGFALLEHYLNRQTLQPTEWIVADGGQTPVVPRRPCAHLWSPSAAGARNLCDNLLRAFPGATGELVAIMEDDDWYAPSHLEILRNQLETPGVRAAGDPLQRYYNIAEQAWRIYHNKGASLCQTGIRRDLLPLLRDVVTYCHNSELFGIDGTFWQKVPNTDWNLLQTGTVVGIKGLPGQAGLGVGHRPDYRRGWQKDPEWQQLREWIGAADLQPYLDIVSPPMAQ